jgi:hypothetical protein
MELVKNDLAKIKSILPGYYNLYICSSSFEDRCLSVASSISTEKMERAIILSSTGLFEHIGPNQQKLMNLFGDKGCLVISDMQNPLITADNLGRSLAAAVQDGLNKSILLDITTFTHESLLILLRLLELHCPKAQITGVYANAAEYSVGDDVHDKWLSKGIGEVRSVLGFPGNIVLSKKTHLVVIVGYEHERAAEIIEAIEPNSISLAYGRSGSATTEKDTDANEHYMHLVKQMASSFSDIHCFEIPCNDPWGASIAIQSHIETLHDVNVLIAPLNNKLSTIGAAWVALKNKDVQLCYARALLYNYSGYSKPGTQCYVFDCMPESGN